MSQVISTTIASREAIETMQKTLDGERYALIEGICNVPLALTESCKALNHIFDHLEPETRVEKDFTTVRATETGALKYDGKAFTHIRSPLSFPKHPDIATNQFLQELIKTSLQMIPDSSYQEKAKVNVGLSVHRSTTPNDLSLHTDPGTYLFTYNFERVGIEGGEMQIAPPCSSEPVVEKVFTRSLDGYAIDQRREILHGRQVAWQHGAKKITKAESVGLEDGTEKLPARKIIVIQVFDE